MLSAYRVLDLSDDRGQLCGQILAGLGADVVLVEPPGGSHSRTIGPFWHDEAGPENSLVHWAHNRGKRSVVLDLDTEDGREHLRRLASGADIVIDSAEPGVMASRGLGPGHLAELNPALITVSITAFGADGPKAGWASSDIVLSAAAGHATLTGDDDRAPLRVGLPQAFYHAATEAAGAALIALYERQHHSGRGQHIDASAQHSLIQATQSMLLAQPLEASHLSRVAGGVKVGPFRIRLRWPCADGFASVTLLFGAAIAPFTQNLMNWAHEEGFCDEATRDKDWVNYATLLFTGQEPYSEYQRICDLLERFFLTKTKAELLEAAFTRRLLITPVTTVAEVAHSPQLEARNYWDDVDHGAGRGTVRHTGPIARFSAAPRPSLPAPALLGEHTDEVLGEAARQPAVAQEPGGGPRTGAALEGLKVLDLMWVMAGPASSRVLADYGATVVRVESMNRIDTARTLQPFRRDSSDPNDSGLFNNMNAGKLGLALDLSKPGARDVVLDLVRWADVVLESFSPKAMAGWGLGYEQLREVKSDIVMLSSCLMGQSGPWSSLAGFGTMASAISGFFNMVGWPDRPPCGPFGAYTDYVSPKLAVAAVMAAVAPENDRKGIRYGPKLAVAAVMAAVEHRRATGQGQYVDLSQAEASLPLLSVALLDYAVNGRVAERHGNDDPRFAPHGIYPSDGEDAWVAVAVESDEQWAAACDVFGRTELAGLSASERLERRRELDDVVAAWTRKRSPAEAMTELQARGVPAHQAQNTVEAFADPQLQHRGHFVEVTHATQGTTWVEGSRIRLSRTPASVTAGAPDFGQHVWEVLHDLLGYDGDKIAELAAAELLE